MKKSFILCGKRNLSLFFDSYAKFICRRPRVNDLTLNSYSIYTRTGRSDTQNPYGVMSPPRQCQTLHLEASFQNVLQLTLGMSCHQHSSQMKGGKRKKKKLQMESVSAGCRQIRAVTHHLFSPLPAFSVSHIMIQSGSNIYLDLNGAVI